MAVILSFLLVSLFCTSISLHIYYTNILLQLDAFTVSLDIFVFSLYILHTLSVHHMYYTQISMTSQ